MTNAVPITKRFDQECDTALFIANDPPTVELPMFDALLAGPATVMDPPPMPRHPRPEPSASVCFWLVLSGYLMGAAQVAVIVWWF